MHTQTFHLVLNPDSYSFLIVSRKHNTQMWSSNWQCRYRSSMLRRSPISLWSRCFLEASRKGYSRNSRGCHKGRPPMVVARVSLALKGRDVGMAMTRRSPIITGRKCRPSRRSVRSWCAVETLRYEHIV